jgi:hypothetical protein
MNTRHVRTCRLRVQTVNTNASIVSERTYKYTLRAAWSKEIWSDINKFAQIEVAEVGIGCTCSGSGSGLHDSSTAEGARQRYVLSTSIASDHFRW